MVNYYKSLSKKYDIEIKKECDEVRRLFINCLSNNFNDSFVCKDLFNDFNFCINQFDKKFRKKYKLNNRLLSD